MNTEKRGTPRTSLILDVQWVTDGLVESGTISDVSLTGCFILTSGKPREGEPVWVNVRMPYGEQFVLFGEVVYIAPEIGFAVNFVQFSDEETRFLNHLINYFETEKELRP